MESGWEPSSIQVSYRVLGSCFISPICLHSFDQGRFLPFSERVWFRQNERRRDQERTTIATLYSLLIYRLLFRHISARLQCDFVRVWYTYLFILIWLLFYSLISAGPSRQIGRDIGSYLAVLVRRDFEDRIGALLTFIYYLPTDSQSYIDGQTWWQLGIGIVRPKERGNRSKALVWGLFYLSGLLGRVLG